MSSRQGTRPFPGAMRPPMALMPAFRAAAVAPLRHTAPSMLDASVLLYEAQLTAENLVATQLQTLTPLSALTLYAAGLLTSLTPCCLSMMPLTVAYFASEGGSSDERGGTIVPALSFTAGLACALAALGVAAATLGKVYGDTAGAGGGEVLRLGVSFLAVGMGLNLLQLLPLKLGLGSLLVDPSALGSSVPRPVRAFLFGASSALVASPCASPVLASILGFVAALGDPLLGGALLVSYTLGYTTPVGIASVLTSRAAQTASELEGTFGWVQPAGGAFLVAFGSYNVLIAGFGPV